MKNRTKSSANQKHTVMKLCVRRTEIGGDEHGDRTRDRQRRRDDGGGAASAKGMERRKTISSVVNDG
ncbi:hypothetical protein U1Q18_023849 [Sarracenia purpurea var. burkii]